MRDSSPMIGLVAAAAALILIPLYKHLSAEPPPLVRSGPERYAAIIEDIDRFWRETYDRQIPDARSAYSSPSVSFAEKVKILEMPEWDLAGVYHGDDARIRIALSDDVVDVAHTIAHEFGHHIQHLSGVGHGYALSISLSAYGRESEGAVLYELQAECLAGVWAADAAARGEPVTRGQVLGMKLRETMSADSTTHGASEQRLAWFDRGFRSGQASVCRETP